VETRGQIAFHRAQQTTAIRFPAHRGSPERRRIGARRRFVRLRLVKQSPKAGIAPALAEVPRETRLRGSEASYTQRQNGGSK
jgi:hypothetical protein